MVSPLHFNPVNSRATSHKQHIILLLLGLDFLAKLALGKLEVRTNITGVVHEGAEAILADVDKLNI